MDLIKDTVKSFFTKKEIEKHYLTKEQKNKYKWQYVNIYVSNGLLILVIIGSISESITNIFIENSLLFIGLTVLLTRELIRIITDTRVNIELIDERIKRREKKNERRRHHTN